MKTFARVLMVCVCGAGCGKPAPSINVRELEKTVDGFSEIGLTKKLDTDARAVYVDPSRWMLLNVDDRSAFGRILGHYCGHKNNSRAYSVEIRDYGTGRRLATWSEYSGYTPD